MVRTAMCMQTTFPVAAVVLSPNVFCFLALQISRWAWWGWAARMHWPTC